MFLLFIIIVFAAYAAAILGAVFLVLALINGVLFLCAKDKNTKGRRKDSFFLLLKVFLVILCVVACMVLLSYVLGSQVTFSM